MKIICISSLFMGLTSFKIVQSTMMIFLLNFWCCWTITSFTFFLDFTYTFFILHISSNIYPYYFSSSYYTVYQWSLNFVLRKKNLPIYIMNVDNPRQNPAALQCRIFLSELPQLQNIKYLWDAWRGSRL